MIAVTTPVDFWSPFIKILGYEVKLEDLKNLKSQLPPVSDKTIQYQRHLVEAEINYESFVPFATFTFEVPIYDFPRMLSEGIFKIPKLFGVDFGYSHKGKVVEDWVSPRLHFIAINPPRVNIAEKASLTFETRFVAWFSVYLEKQSNFEDIFRNVRTVKELFDAISRIYPVVFEGSWLKENEGRALEKPVKYKNIFWLWHWLKYDLPLMFDDLGYDKVRIKPVGNKIVVVLGEKPGLATYRFVIGRKPRLAEQVAEVAVSKIEFDLPAWSWMTHSPLWGKTVKGISSDKKEIEVTAEGLLGEAPDFLPGAYADLWNNFVKNMTEEQLRTLRATLTTPLLPNIFPYDHVEIKGCSFLDGIWLVTGINHRFGGEFSTTLTLIRDLEEVEEMISELSGK